jgi:hypothetical protein
VNLSFDSGEIRYRQKKMVMRHDYYKCDAG